MFQQENEQFPSASTEDQKEISIENGCDFICIDPKDIYEYARNDSLCAIDFNDKSGQYSEDEHPSPPILKGNHSNQCLYIDHCFDVDSGCLKVKSKADDEYYVVNSGNTHTGDVQKYFDSINYNNVVSNKINVNNLYYGDVEDFIRVGKESYFLVNINGEKHIANKDIIPSSIRNFIYEKQNLS